MIVPLPGMVRLWALEAFAHGAEVVSFFRWRQAPFGQEQMHAGLLRPDDKPAPGLQEAAKVAREIAEMPDVDAGQSDVALIFDYESAWAIQVQPQGQGQDYFALVFDTYRTLRRLGLNVDVVGPDAALSDYKLIAAPGLFQVPRAIDNFNGLAVLGPRTGLKTPDFAIPSDLAPRLSGLECRIVEVESLRPDMPVPLTCGGQVEHWFETLESPSEALKQAEDGRAAVVRSDNKIYIAGQLDPTTMFNLYRDWLSESGVTTTSMPVGVRQRTAGQRAYVFNHAAEVRSFRGRELPPASVTEMATPSPGKSNR